MGTSDSPLVAGDRLNDYELLCPVGEGGMATVWIARLTRKRGFEKLVAIKTILAQHAEDESFQEMFFDEARIASRIEHPNVAHIHDLGEERGLVFLVMEYIDGHALTLLRKTLRKAGRPFPIGIATRIMADACAGLYAAHELRNHDGSPLGVVHRDVSPQNVLISTVGISKLIDFGVAKAVNRLASRTSTGYVKGKIQYMSPEQALAKDVDHRADIWGVGAVLYTLISGKYPFDSENHLALLSRLQRQEAPPPLPASTPLPVAAIIDRALSHDPDQRFQTAEEMRVALEESGHMASHREVGTFLLQVLGPQTEERRRAINAARAAAEMRSHPPYASVDDDLLPTTPNARAPASDDNAVTRRKPRPGPVHTVQMGQAPVVSAPQIIVPVPRKSVPDITARMDPSLTRPPSSPNLQIPTPIEGLDLQSRSGVVVASLAPIEGSDLQSRTGVGTNAGVASGGSYAYVPPAAAPAPVPSKPRSSAWIVVGAAVAGLLLALVVIAFVTKSAARR
ncbi:MAG: protein kinase [Labilithrix sp.]